MDDRQHQRIVAAQHGWREAEKAYSDEVDKYVSTAWTSVDPLHTPERPVTSDALTELARLRKAADEARDAFWAVFR